MVEPVDRLLDSCGVEKMDEQSMRNDADAVPVVREVFAVPCECQVSLVPRGTDLERSPQNGANSCIGDPDSMPTLSPYVTSGVSSSTGRSNHSAAISRILTVKVGAHAIKIDSQYNLLSI